MKKNQNQKILRMAEMAMLIALVVVLQLLGGMIKIGPFSLSFVLLPVVIGSLILGPTSGAVLGAIFGIVVLIQCATGVDVGGNILWSINPFYTITICMAKGMAAGLVPGLIFLAFQKKERGVGVRHVTAVLASASAPIVNTGLFLVGLSVFFYDTLVAWAGGTNVLAYVITGLVGLNFIIELAINLVVAPAVATIVTVVTKQKN